MGEHELREALRRETQARIRALWGATEDAVVARRAEVDAEIAALREAANRLQAATLEGERRALLAAAELTARQQQLAAETSLGERLYRLATGLLPDLAAMGRHELWIALAAELPVAEWQRVQVHPEDLPLARARFPAADLSGDPALGGGLIAETADGRIVVDNSLAGRLARCWPRLRTELLTAIREEVERDAAGSATAG